MSAPHSATGAPLGETYDVEAIRADFPILAQEVRGKPLVYLDNAASTQKPQAVIDAISGYYERDHSNVHRGVHTLSQRATEAYEAARTTLQRFLGAREDREVIFTRGTTEALNLVAHAWGMHELREGDEVLITHLEHHSNIVPWQLVAARTGAVLKVAAVDDSGALDMESFHALLGPRTRFVSVVHVSNALGTLNPVAEIVEAAHRHGALVLLDGAQAVSHLPVNVQDLGCDFYTLSGHKMYGPTGIGALWGRAEIMEAMEPWQGGGDMIENVSFAGSTWAKLPSRFEAGTPNMAGAVGLAAAADYIEAIGRSAIAAWEDELLAYGTELLSAVPGLRLVGTAPEKLGVLSFVLEGIHPHDVGTLLDQAGVAVRTGHHCTQPLMERLGVPATARASLALYNTREELDALADAVRVAQRLFS